MCKEFDQPNGICFSPDHQRLYVADSGKGQRIGAFPVDKDGKLGAPVFWIAQGSDGMRCDALGNLWTTGLAGLTVYSPEGKPLVEIQCPSTPTNCAFGGADGKTLFVTARKHLCRLPVLVAGAPLPSWLPAADRGATKSGDEDGTRR